METEIIVMGMGIILLASITQGLAGFGFALISVPLLTLIFPLSEVVPVVVGLSLLTNVLMLVRLWKQIEIRKIWLLLLSSFIGIPIGSYILLVVNSSVLQVIVGILILVFSILLLLKFTYPIRNEYIAFPTTGIISGLLNSSISVSGPPLVLFLSNQGKEKDVFKANLVFYGFVLNVITLVMFRVNGVLNGDVIRVTLYFLIVMAVGIAVGMSLASRIREDWFKKVVIGLLIVSSISVTVNGIVKLL